MDKAAKIILAIAGGLIFASLVVDVIAGNWWTTVAVLAAMGVAGFFTIINLLARGEGKTSSRKEKDSRKAEE